MVVRELVAAFGIKTDKNSVKRANSAVASFKKIAVAATAAFAAGGAIAFGLKRLTDQVAALGDDLDKTSKRLGISTDALQELRFAAGLAGVGQGELSTSLRMVQKSAFEAARGSKTYVEAFEQIGVEVRDTNGQLKSAEQLLTESADGFARLESDTQRAALAQALFGRSGVTLVPLLKQGSDAIREQRQEAQELGLIDDQLVKASADLTDMNLRLDKALLFLKATIAGELMPSIIALKEELVDWWKKNKPIVKQVVVGFVGGFKKFANVLVAIASIFTDKYSMAVLAATGATIGLMAATKALAIAYAATGAAGVFAAAKVAGAWLLAQGSMLLMVAGIAAIIAVVALLIDDFITMGDGGESVTGTLIEGFQKLKEELGSVSAALTDMINFSIDFWLDKLPGPAKTAVDLMLANVRAFTTAATGLFTSLFQFFADIFTGEGVIKSFSNLLNNMLTMVKDSAAQLFNPFKQLFGIGETGTLTPGATVGGSGAGAPVVMNVTANIGTNVSATTGASPEQIAEAVGPGVRETLDSVMTEARDRLTPQRATAF